MENLKHSHTSHFFFPSPFQLFSESKDEVALIVMGTAGTQNPLFDDEVSEKDYSHISVVRPLAPADFDAVKIVEGDLEPSDYEADWVDALVIAVDFFQRATKYVLIVMHFCVVVVSLIYMSPIGVLLAHQDKEQVRVDEDRAVDRLLRPGQR